MTKQIVRIKDKEISTQDFICLIVELARGLRIKIINNSHAKLIILHECPEISFLLSLAAKIADISSVTFNLKTLIQTDELLPPNLVVASLSYLPDLKKLEPARNLDNIIFDDGMLFSNLANQLESFISKSFQFVFAPKNKSTSIVDLVLLGRSEIKKSNRTHDDFYREYLSSSDFSKTKLNSSLFIGEVFFPLWFQLNSSYSLASELFFRLADLGSISSLNISTHQIRNFQLNKNATSRIGVIDWKFAIQLTQNIESIKIDSQQKSLDIETWIIVSSEFNCDQARLIEQKIGPKICFLCDFAPKSIVQISPSNTDTFNPLSGSSWNIESLTGDYELAVIDESNLLMRSGEKGSIVLKKNDQRGVPTVKTYLYGYKMENETFKIIADETSIIQIKDLKVPSSLIEEKLNSLKGVLKSKVYLSESSKKITAEISIDPLSEISEELCRHHLENQLPLHLIPGTYVISKL